MRRIAAFAIAALAAAAFLLRGIDRLRQPALFAEDGQIFLADAHNLGLRAFIEPYAGYLHTIPRIVAAVLDPFPLTAAPVNYAVAAMLIHLLMLTPALSARLSVLLPELWTRVGLFATLCVMPAMWEVYGNVANSIFVAGTALLLLVISADPRTRTGRRTELVALVLVGLSGPLIVLFSPFFLWRWWHNRTAHSFAVLAVVAVTAGVQLAVYLTSTRSTPGGGTAVLVAKTAGERVGGSWLVGKSELFAGRTPGLLELAAYLWVALVVVVSVVVVPKIAIPLWLLFAVLLGAAVNAYGPAMVASAIAFQRHISTPSAICIVLIWVVIGSRSGRKTTLLAAVLLAAGAYGVVHDLVPEPYPERPDLSDLAACVADDQPVCEQPIFGDPWTVVLRQ